MLKFLRLLIDLGQAQDECRLELMPSCTLHHDLNFIFLWKLYVTVPLVQMTFHSCPLIFICPDPILNHFYLISVVLRTF